MFGIFFLKFIRAKVKQIKNFYIVLIIKIPEIHNCERASYFFGLCEYSVNKKFSIPGGPKKVSIFDPYYNGIGVKY
jgi:hypothetical protein